MKTISKPWIVVNNDGDEWVIEGPEIRGLRGKEGKEIAELIVTAVNAYMEKH